MKSVETAAGFVRGRVYFASGTEVEKAGKGKL